jgi:hypothetical protein
LRQLGQYKAAILRELLNVLETVQTLDQLLRILHQAMQECVLAKAGGYPFIHLPTNHDLAVLTTDVEQYGVRLVASTLLILSSLRYQPREVDTYEIQTLIGVLLSLVRSLTSLDVSTALEREDPAPTPAAISSLVFDEGEADL